MEPKIVGNRIKQLMGKKNIEKEVIKKKLNITEEELDDKLEGKKEFYANEMFELVEIFNLDIDTSSKLFFGEEFDVERVGEKKEEKV